MEFIKKLARASTDHPVGSVKWARATLEFGDALLHCHQISRERNVLNAITCFETVMRRLSRETEPTLWKDAQSRYIGAWEQYPLADNDNYQRQHLATLQHESDFFREDEGVEKWLGLQRAIGCTWSDLSSGGRQANLLNAISHLERALKIVERAPKEWWWAEVNARLGSAWCNLASWDDGANLRRGIAYLEQALQGSGRDKFYRAEAQTSLACAWRNTLSGNRDENRRKAIAYLEQAASALHVSEGSTDHASSFMWADVQRLLGLVWMDLEDGARPDNLRTAIAHLERSLPYTRRVTDLPIGCTTTSWVVCHRALGDAWASMPGRHPDQLMRAMSHYQRVQEVWTKEMYPIEHDMIGYQIDKLSNELAAPHPSEMVESSSFSRMPSATLRSAIEGTASHPRRA